jgi:hypothetical protein
MLELFFLFPGKNLFLRAKKPKCDADSAIWLVVRRGLPLFWPFFLKHRSHSISFTRPQGIPKYKIGFGREKDGRVGRDSLRGAL